MTEGREVISKVIARSHFRIMAVLVNRVVFEKWVQTRGEPTGADRFWTFQGHRAAGVNPGLARCHLAHGEDLATNRLQM